jgi:AcrR family transcriptional regulator
MTAHPYHHGDLRRTLLAVAAEAVAATGPASLSLRDLARRAGVSHAAPAHHFGDKAGLLTALAAEGYEVLADALADARERTGSLLEIGVAYVRFAVEHRAHFEVMFRPDLYRADDPDLARARRRRVRSLRTSQRLNATNQSKSRWPHAG